MSEQNPAVFIRTVVFGFEYQWQFAEALGCKQPTISRWENGEPFSSTAMRKIRELAAAKKIEFDTNWFFEVPVRKAA